METLGRPDPGVICRKSSSYRTPGDSITGSTSPEINIGAAKMRTREPIRATGVFTARTLGFTVFIGRTSSAF
jgi:hypothetical protein